MDCPLVSVVIPTYNCALLVRDCLDSLLFQDYPKDRLELIIADGGSTDGTKDVIEAFSGQIETKLIGNNLKTGEAGKAAGIKQAKGEIVAFIDSDNILPDKDWLKKMLEPFSDQEIIASEPLYYTYRKQDALITRYSALLGMNDPLCLFLGNYDRYNVLTGKWTEMNILQREFSSYLEVGFKDSKLPTIGANGFFIRKNELLKYPFKDYFFDIDMMQFLYSLNQGIKVAKVKTGIIHIYSKNLLNFFAKQSRRFQDYTYYNAKGLRQYQWNKVSRIKIIKFVLYTILGLTILQSIKGYLLKRDTAWFFHPVACLVTLLVYGCLSLKNFLFPLHPKKR